MSKNWPAKKAKLIFILLFWLVSFLTKQLSETLLFIKISVKENLLALFVRENISIIIIILPIIYLDVGVYPATVTFMMLMQHNCINPHHHHCHRHCSYFLLLIFYFFFLILFLTSYYFFYFSFLIFFLISHILFLISYFIFPTLYMYLLEDWSWQC